MAFPTFEEILQLKQAGTKNIWKYLADKYSENPEKLRAWFRRETDKRGSEAEEILMDIPSNQNEVESDEKYKASKSFVFNEDGNAKYISSNRLVLMTEEEEKDSEFVLKAHGFDAKEWLVVSLVNNYWQSMRMEDMGSATLYQSKLSIKPKSEKNIVTLDDINNFFTTYKYNNFSQSRNKFLNYDFNGKTLIINLADPHYGCEEKITTVEKVSNLIDEIIYRSETRGIRFSRIILASLGDILHIDNDAGQTTGGTQVGDRGIIYHFWEEALKSMIDSINKLKRLAPVEFISIGGNHDKTNSFTLSKALQYYFSKDVDVKFDVDFSERKYLMIGNSVFGLCHGDIPSKNISTLIQREAREMYGKSKYAYLLLGHIHHIDVKDENGVIRYNLPSPSHTDYWHNSKAYTGAWHGTWSFIIDDKRGIEDVWQIES